MENFVPRILGIDPGSRVTGVGVIEIEKNKVKFIYADPIKLQGDFYERVKQLSSRLKEVVEQYLPDYVSIEQVFVHKNAASALKLGQARGAALASISQYNLKIFEYTPREVKQAVVGYGGADKEQIQNMIKLLLNLPKVPQSDAADALAIALCHANNINFDKFVNSKLSSSLGSKLKKTSGKKNSWRSQTEYSLKK